MEVAVEARSSPKRLYLLQPDSEVIVGVYNDDENLQKMIVSALAVSSFDHKVH